MSAVFESITKLRIGEWNVRIWRTEKEPDAITNHDLMRWQETMTHYIVMEGKEVTRELLLRRGAEFDNVSAIEVTDDTGAGTLIYTDWP